MSDYFFDPMLIKNKIQSVLSLTVNIIDNANHVNAAHILSTSPAVLIMPLQTQASGPDGCGNGREIKESIGIIIQFSNTVATVGSEMRTIRAELFALLEGNRIDVNWAPLRYVGGELFNNDNGDHSGMYRWIETYETEKPAPVRYV